MRDRDGLRVVPVCFFPPPIHTLSLTPNPLISLPLAHCSIPPLIRIAGAFLPRLRPTHVMKMNQDLLANVRIASPCNARWEDMEGDDRSRFCRHCSKNVYNFSAMTAQAAAELIRAREGNLCGRFYQRTDGTMLTADCPAVAERRVHWLKRWVSAAAACLCLGGSSAISEEKPRLNTIAATSSMGGICVQPQTNRFKMGEVCVQPSATNAVNQTTNKPALMGKIAAPPQPPTNTPKSSPNDR